MTKNKVSVMCVELPCGYSSQTLAKFAAYADIFLSLCTLGIFIILREIIVSASTIAISDSGSKHLFPQNDSQINLGQFLGDSLMTPSFQAHYSQEYKCLVKNDSFKLLLTLLGIFYFVGTFILALILLNGAQRRNHNTLQRWLKISVLLWFVRILLVVVWMITGPGAEDRVGPIFIGFFNAFYNGVVMTVVQSLIRHIEEEGVILYATKTRKKKQRLYN